MTKNAVLEPRFIALIAQEVGCRPHQVEAAAGLFAEGATVPFVARYRKEATGGLEDLQLETLFKRREYFLELAERRDAILESIREQGKLTGELEAAIRAAVGKQELEDLYLPYKPKRRTRAQIAREKGLEPLADALLAHAVDPGRRNIPVELAAPFVDAEKEVEDAAAALAGARDILAERLAENAERRAELRRTLAAEGVLRVRVLPGKETDPEAAVYRDYFEHDEPGRDIPSHRLLAILRGEREGFLISDLRIDDEREAESLARAWGVPVDTPCGQEIAAATADGYKRLLRPSITNEVRAEMRERAEAQAIAVFRANLEALLLQAPLGQLTVMGLDPGYRTGCKLAVVDGTGRVVATDVIHPIQPHANEAAATATVLRLIQRHGVHAVAIGNGTASRETEAFARKVVQEAKLEKVVVAIVPETGASVYSASAVAREELPQLDVSLRGAVSIARRLQDPLAELVKIEPRSLGVGQYQHDVDQKALEKELDTAVEGAVNRVGVELNTASAPLLRRISGLTERTARNIVDYRDANGPFRTRQALLRIPGFGPRTFELSAGFLRVRGGDNPLDSTAVHPERYPVVQQMAAQLQVPLQELIGNPELVSRVDFGRFANEEQSLGVFTLEDIRAELLRPGRDPRPEFRTPEWRADVTSVKDLQPGMVLEGRVSNVTNFGAFVDIGVHRDGLVHVSELTHRWVADPREAAKVGEIVKVKVLEVDYQRERISLSIKALQQPPASGGNNAARPAAGSAARGGRSVHGAESGAERGPGRKGGSPAPAPPRPPRPASTLEDLMRKFNRR